MNDVILPALRQLIETLDSLAEDWKSIPMLAHTHGQPASPTTVGKELRVFVERLDYQFDTLSDIEHFGKFGGATGNFNAHLSAFGDHDWRAFSDDLLSTIGLSRIQTTTQIDHYDHLAELLHGMNRISTILIDLCRDIWSYISMEYFTQKQ